MFGVRGPLSRSSIAAATDRLAFRALVVAVPSPAKLVTADVIAPHPERLRPRMARTAPRRGGLAPLLERQAPHVGRSPPGRGQYAPRVEEHAPRAGRLAPHVEEDPPSVGLLGLHVDGNAPNVGGIPPHAEGNAPHAEGFPPVAPAQPLQGGMMISEFKRHPRLSPFVHKVMYNRHRKKEKVGPREGTLGSNFRSARAV